VTRSLGITWPDPAPFSDRAGRPIRLLAISDETDPALEQPRNREALAPVDAVVGAGDLDPDYLAMLGDAFNAPLAYVLGNHDRPLADAYRHLPDPIDANPSQPFPLPLVGLSWAHPGAHRVDRAAWLQLPKVGLRRLVGRPPLLVVSHVPPQGAGDGPDRYHHGEPAYRWLLDRLRPPLWLHGHTTLATVADWRETYGPTTLVNVTGSVLVEVAPPTA
jgi:hypothetical protein